MAAETFMPTTDKVLWAVTDGNGTVDYAVDNAGALVNHVEYTSCGAPTGGTQIIAGMAFGQSGMRYDVATGEYVTANRIFDPVADRFESNDPADQGTNFSIACNNNWTINSDPSGLWSVGASNSGGLSLSNINWSYNLPIENYSPSLASSGGGSYGGSGESSPPAVATPPKMDTLASGGITLPVTAATGLWCPGQADSGAPEQVAGPPSITSLVAGGFVGIPNVSSSNNGFSGTLSSGSPASVFAGAIDGVGAGTLDDGQETGLVPAGPAVAAATPAQPATAGQLSGNEILLQPGESLPSQFQSLGPNGVPTSLSGTWKVSVVANDGHAWIRYENVDDSSDVHTAGRYEHGYGGRTDADGNLVVSSVVVSGVQWDHDLMKEQGFQAGLYPSRSVVVNNPTIYDGGTNGLLGFAVRNNNCTTYAAAAWKFYSGENACTGVLWDDPGTLKLWIQGMNHPVPDNGGRCSGIGRVEAGMVH